MNHHYHRVHPRLRGVRSLAASPSFPAGSLSPAQILTAYGFKQNQFAGIQSVKLGIGSLGGGVVQADIDNSVARWGMAAPKLTVRTVDGAVNDPSSDQDSNVENMLDIVPTMAFCWWWLTGAPADITICFGPNVGAGMALVTEDLVAAGVEVMSWSWGSAADQWAASDRAALSKAFADGVAKGVTFFAAAGDNSIDDGDSAPSADYPCSDPNVWAVGGTHLVIDASGARSDESAWGDGNPGDEGGGGGFDPTVPQPSFQNGIVPGTSRGVPDTSADADPNSGWQMSANGSWTVIGGTSASSPFTAALCAIARGVAKGAINGRLVADIYSARTTACNDITKGSNGDPATVGWDPATGLGSPNGPAFISALSSVPITGPAPTPPIPPPVLPPPPTPAPTATLGQAEQWAMLGLRNHWAPPATLAQAQEWASLGLKNHWPK
jgi:kumamolisin